MISKPRGKNQNGEYLAFDFELYGDPRDEGGTQFEEQRARTRLAAMSKKRCVFGRGNEEEGVTAVATAGATTGDSTDGRLAKRQKRHRRRNSKGEELGYDAYTFVSGDPNEMQFEELRAKLMLQRKQQQQQQLLQPQQRELPTLIAALPPQRSQTMAPPPPPLPQPPPQQPSSSQGTLPVQMSQMGQMGQLGQLGPMGAGGMMMMTGPHGWAFDPGSTGNVAFCAGGYGTFSGSTTFGTGYPMNWGYLTANNMSGIVGHSTMSSMSSGDKGSGGGSCRGEGSDESEDRASEIVSVITSLPPQPIQQCDAKHKKDRGGAKQGQHSHPHPKQQQQQGQSDTLQQQQPQQQQQQQQQPLRPVNPLSKEHTEKVLAALEQVEGRMCGDGRFVEVPGALSMERQDRLAVAEDAEYLVDQQSCTQGGEHTQYLAVRHRWDPVRRRFAEEREEAVTLKVGASPCFGEWYIYRVLSERTTINNNNNNSNNNSNTEKPFFEEFDKGYFFENTSVLVAPGRVQRTFQSTLQDYQMRGLAVPEVLVMYLAQELLGAVDRLHRAGVIHLDIQPSTIGIAIANANASVGAGAAGAHRAVAVVLLDYLHSVDRRLYPPGQLYEWDLEPTFFDCAEMREKKPWGFQIDNHGIAISIYCLLMMEWPDFAQDPAPQGSGRPFVLRFKKGLRPEWQTAAAAAVWEPLLTTLLNSRDDTDLVECGRGIRAYFEANPSKVDELQEILRSL